MTIHLGSAQIEVSRNAKIVGISLTTISCDAMQPSTVVYVIVVTPGERAVSKPLLLMVATDSFELCQGSLLLGVPEPVNCVVNPLQIEVSPDKAVKEGSIIVKLSV